MLSLELGKLAHKKAKIMEMNDKKKKEAIE